MILAEKTKPFAAVILLRAAAPHGIEVFLTRRPQSAPFFAGMYGFPGGQVQKNDCADGLLRRCRGLSAEGARAIVGAHFAPRAALGFWIAAIRELFEEAGILFAVTAVGTAAPTDPQRAARRRDPSYGFQDLLERENLFCDASRLAYFSHWQTPSQLSPRFDMRLFVAALPDRQTPLTISPELSHTLWITPDHALGLYARGELPMIFPTFAALRTLADFDSVESVLKDYRKEAAH